MIMLTRITNYFRRLFLVVLNRAYVYDKCAFENMDVHWGQCAEDAILRSLFRNVDFAGTYVDVGAHHPTALSNTCFFYNRGWRGINIDASQESIALFDQYRPHDVNLNVGIGSQGGNLEFHRFECSLFDTFDSDMAHKWSKYSNKVRIEVVKCYPLSYILQKYLPDGSEIDLLSIDVEGLEIDVINSNNWDRYRPKIIVVEQLERGSLATQSESVLTKMLANLRYVSVAIAGHSQYFMRDDIFAEYVDVETA